MNPEGTLPLLTAMCAPAVLINACGLFVLSTAQRLGRQVERVRVMSGTPAQIRLTTRRAHLLQRALAAQYVAICLFVAAVIAVAATRLLGPGSSWLPVLLALAGVAALFYSCVLLLIESREAYDSVHRETTAALARTR